MIIRSPSKAITQLIGEILAKSIKKTNRLRSSPFIVALKGNLGSGKTTFTQGFARGLGIKQQIISPTFLIMRHYRLKKITLLHVDTYRIKKPKEMVDLGFKDECKKMNHIVLVEWAEKIKNLLSKNTLWINFSYGKKENERIIKIPKF